MENISIGSRLAELRNKLSLTQDEVAGKLGISNKTLSKWENCMSEPSITMLARLSEIYGVSTDYILGIKNAESVNSTSLLKEELMELDFENQILKTYTQSYEMLRAKVQYMFRKSCDEKTIVPSRNILDNHPFCHSCIETNEEFEMHVNTDEVSMYVQLLGNRQNFAWLSSEEKQERMAKLFSFLSKNDALRVIKLIHTKTTSANISASFVAQNTGLTVEKATEILNEACEINLCTKNVAHLKDKDVTIYVSRGSGKILSIVCLAYQYIYGGNGSDYMLCSQNCRLIDGGTK